MSKSIDIIYIIAYWQTRKPDPERNIADEKSWVATSRLVNWHRSYNESIWLDEDKGDIELVHRLQVHPWIIGPFDSLEDELVKEPKHRELCVDAILRWNDEVEKLRQSGELIIQWSVVVCLHIYIRLAWVAVPLHKWLVDNNIYYRCNMDIDQAAGAIYSGKSVDEHTRYLYHRLNGN